MDILIDFIKFSMRLNAPLFLTLVSFVLGSVVYLVWIVIGEIIYQVKARVLK